MFDPMIFLAVLFLSLTIGAFIADSMKHRFTGVSVRVMHAGDEVNASVGRTLAYYGAKICDDAPNVLFITKEKTDETEEDDNSIRRKTKVRLRISIERNIGLGEVYREDILTDNIHLTGPHIVAMLERWGGTVLTFKRHK